MNELLDFFDEASAEFQKPQVGIGGGTGAGGGGPLPLEVNLISPPGVEIVARNLNYGEPQIMASGTTSSLQQGTYEFAFRERGNTISKVVRDVPESGEVFAKTMQIQFAPGEVGPVRESIIRATAGDADSGIVDFSETLGGPIMNRDLGLWLSLMGASHIMQDPGSFSKLRGLSINNFSTMLPGTSRIYLMAGSERYRQVAASVAGQPKRLEAIPELDRVFQASFDALGGSNLVSVQIDNAAVRTYASFCLPNRVTFLVFSDDADGRLAVKQFFLPVFHLMNYLDPMVRGRLNNEPPLQTMLAMYGFQNQFVRGRILNPPNKEDQERWQEALYGKWLDPVTSLIVCYDIIRRGDESRKRELREIVLPNLNRFFPGIPDIVALAELLNVNPLPIPVNPPLFVEGLLAFPDWEDLLPYTSEKLDYGASWITWIAAEPQLDARTTTEGRTAQVGVTA
jgi:hypothetical protein